MDEQERVRGMCFAFRSSQVNDMSSAAISMTLCELSTASHSPPMECTGFTVASHSSSTPATGESHRSCVESVAYVDYMRVDGPDCHDRALSRSAQYWSSYSGFLREVCT